VWSTSVLRADGAAQRKLSAYVDPYDQRPGGRRPGGWWFATETDVEEP
jgi:hypothetical protein